MMYREFLTAFGDQHSFQTFDDKGKNKTLIKQLHGHIDEHIDELAMLNQKGAGVYFTVNKTDLQGRTTKNIEQVRAVFCDFDGTPLPENFDVLPHLIINTSLDKYHVYWLVKDLPLESFTLYQQALASKFASDPVVKDLPRIMRVAGFYHNKKQPYPVKIVEERIMGAYTKDEIRDGFNLVRPKKRVFKFNSNYKHTYNGGVTGATQGDRHARLVRMVISIIKRGEDYQYARGEVLKFNSMCNPPNSQQEVLWHLDDMWSRYATA